MSKIEQEVVYYIEGWTIYTLQIASPCSRSFFAMVMASQTLLLMAGLLDHSPSINLPMLPTTKPIAVLTLVLLNFKDSHRPPLVLTSPPAKEREPHNDAWTVVAHHGIPSHKTPPLAQAVEQGTFLSCLKHCGANMDPTAISVEQTQRATMLRPRTTKHISACMTSSDQRQARASVHTYIAIKPPISDSDPSEESVR